MNKRVLIIIISFLLLSIIPAFSCFNIALANDLKVTYESVNPNSETKYKLKRLSEKLQGTYIKIFKKNQVISHSAKLANRRFVELVYVVEKDEVNYLETATSRYMTHIGLLKEKIESNDQQHLDIKDNFINQPEVLSWLRDKHPSQTAEWLFLQQAVDTANVLISDLD